MTDLNDTHIEFLRSVVRHGGEATTSQIRADAGLSRGEIKYYFPDLEERGLIRIETADEAPNGGFPPRIAVLTDEAEQRIRKGNIGGNLLNENEDQDEQTVTVTKSEFEELHGRLDRHENRLDALAARTATQHGDTGASGDLEEKVEELEFLVEVALKTLRQTEGATVSGVKKRLEMERYDE
ncbi:MarR family transcriptional regulator [Halopiger djelfimassiliensis]|uniref:MarR family transcriptional regulator n=1 Tax=Halopiger djelfimassiliensis TaxID=1293047 RepID=UPI000677EDC2|nr:MarR family transcriptional regulator [Halopiger djelfimassiliensis]